MAIVTGSTAGIGCATAEGLARTGAAWITAQLQAEGITTGEAEQAFLEANRPTTLIKRFATTEEVSNMIVYLCSEQSSATTGAMLRVDGGVVRFIA